MPNTGCWPEPRLTPAAGISRASTRCTATTSTRGWPTTGSNASTTSCANFFAESDSNWNQTFYVLLFRTIGDVTNRDAFLTLARRVSYRMVLRERASLYAVEAMLIGASGLLDNYRDDAYTRSLKQDFDYFSRKYEIAPMTGAEWNLRDIRPANHPLLRIAQLAAFLASNDFLIDRLVECRTAEEVRRLFSAEASDYWYTHYIPATPTRELPKRIGRTKSDLLGINLVSLIQYAYGAYNGNERLRERAFALLEAIPAEENRFMRRWRLYDLRPANAFQSQALLQLATEYCDRRRCAECPVGRRPAGSAQTVRPRRRIPQPTLTL